MNEFQLALTSLSAAMTAGQAFLGARDAAKSQESLIEFNAAIIDAQSKIMAAQASQTVLATKVDELEKECERLKDWSAEKKNYAFTNIAKGVFVYLPKVHSGNFQNAQKLCCNCFDHGKKSTLQESTTIEHRRIKVLSCHNRCPDLKFDHYLNNSGD